MIGTRERLQAIALDAFKYWDSDHNMKVGKILRALAGEMPGYRSDIDALLADLRSQRANEPRIHDLKTWPEFFNELLTGTKTFEVRRNDRDFRVGDTLVLMEWSQTYGYTGRQTVRQVSSILTGPAFGLQSGFVCMSLSLNPLSAGAASDAERPVPLGSAA